MANEVKKMLKRKRAMKLKYFLYCLTHSNHYPYLKKNDVFKELGQCVLYQPNTLPNEPKCIKIHNNIQIAAHVTFYTHDVINNVLSHMDNISYQSHGTCIEIMDNVFIGGNSTIVGNVTIGPNAIVAAGSVVTKDVPENTIVGGNPAKVIGSFEDLHARRKTQDVNKKMCDTNLRNEELWNIFYEEKEKRNGYS